MTSLRSKLADGGTVVGSWLNSGSTIIAELMATAGFDFLTIDAEHSAVGIAAVQQMLQAIRSGAPNCAGLVRAEGTDYAVLKRYMDAGAEGIIAPLVLTRSQAEEVVRAVKYPPVGERGLGYCRANQYGMEIEGAVERSNENSFVCVQIEHVEAVRNLDAILSVDGVDAAIIGPYDLTASMGIPGQFDHDEYLKARQVILEGCVRHQVAPGTHVVAPEPGEVDVALREGFRFVAYSLDITLITHFAGEGLAAIRARAHQP